MKTFYITTPIYYVNDSPHIGHAYTTIMADVIKRFKKLQGKDVFFLTGTDEHGQKIERSAAEKNISPKELADSVVVRFKKLWDLLNIDYDHFIRTTDEDHIAGVKKIFTRVRDNGDIYAGDYRGHYCVSDESFVSDTAEDTEDGNKICPDCGKKTQVLTEKCYFFRLSAYQEKLLAFYREHPDFVMPQSRMNEVVSMVRMGLNDLSITRSTVEWGVPVPDDEEQTIYVWFDALTNYLTGVGYSRSDRDFARYWPADLHIMAKDILKFHAVYWPAFLMAAGIEPPGQELIHGWWLKDEKKMSKSTGNILDPHIVLKHFNSDSLRYFLMREAPIGADGNFSHQGFINRVNSDLANDWGNLISRTGSMIEKYFDNHIPESAEYADHDKKVEEGYHALAEQVIKHFESHLYNRGLEAIFEYIKGLNRYIVESQPWELAKEKNKRDRLAAVLKTVSRAILSVNQLLSPVIPESTEKVDRFFNHNPGTLGWQDPGEEITIKKLFQLFPRVDIEDFFADDGEQEEKKMNQEVKSEGLIDFKEFQRVKMVVARVVSAEKVAGTDKLIQMSVDTGDGERTLVAGVAPFYSPEDLTDRKILMVKNLKPATIRGIRSEGMILAASGEDGRPYIPVLPEDTPIGAVLH